MPKGKPNKRYTPEFNIEVVETMHKEKLGYHEAARQFDVPQWDKTVAKWRESILKKVRRAYTLNAVDVNQQVVRQS